MEDKAVYCRVPVASIITDGQMVREHMDDDYILELSSSIARVGLLQPIVVTEAGDKYQLCAGAHRLAAVKRLGWHDVPAHVYSSPPLSTTKTTALIENVIRKQMTVKEECLAVMQLMEGDGLSPSSISDLLGRSRGWVDTRIALLGYPEDLQEAVYDGSLSLQKAELIAGVKDEGMRRSIAQQTISLKLRLAEVRSLCEVAEANPQISDAVEAGLRAQAEVLGAQKVGRCCDSCGRFRQWQNLRVWWLCEEGCENVISEIASDHDDTLGGTMQIRKEYDDAEMEADERR